MRKNSTIIGLIIITLTGVVFMKCQAAEETIPIHIYKDFYPVKRRLVDVIYYESKPKVGIHLLIPEDVDEGAARAVANFKVPKGPVKSIRLMLTNYHEGPDPRYNRETVIASLIFRPIPSSVLDITFTIEGRTIRHNAIYHLPPLFVD